MKKTVGSMILVVICLFLAACSNKDEFKTELKKIAVPNMSSSILELNETDQFVWMSEISKFEIDTLRSKTSDLTEENINSVKDHLSQVFGTGEANLLIDGFYEYDEVKQTHYVPDGDWYTVNERWLSSQITITEHSGDNVTLMLNGIDEFELKVTIQYDFSIHNGKLLLEKRTYLE